MTNLREQPLRLERALTQDYINRAVKMREIEERIAMERDRPFWTAVFCAFWALVIASLCVWLYMNL